MESLIDRMQCLVSGWMPFLDSHLWRFPKDLDGDECLVYGTGYSSWGVWTVINPAMTLAGSLDWDPKRFEDAPKGLRTRGERLNKCLGLVRYILGYHATGDFDGAGGDRWTGEPKGPGEPQGYANWHSPLWTALLGDVMLTIWDEVPESVRERFLRAVRQDAEIQTGLDLENFRGWARQPNDRPQGRVFGPRGTHPEGNSWKASLLTLARSLMPDDPQTKAWEERERILWASSFSRPEDETSDELVDGKRLGDLVVGSHLCPSFAAIHHGFLHPCYTTFPLFSRVQARTYCTRAELEYPAAAARLEGEVLARLLHFVVNGRLVHPAGSDWPEWAYHQFYLMAVLAYHHACGTADLSEQIEGFVSNIERDARASAGGALIAGRFRTLIERDGQRGHRFESDAPAALVYAERSLSSKPAGGKLSIPDLEPRFCEDQARTVYERRPSGAYGFSSRTPSSSDGLTQITLVSARRPHLSIWSGNGCCIIDSLHVPQGVGNRLTDSAQRLLDQRGFAGRAVVSHGSPYLPCLTEMEVRCALPPEKDLLLIHQKVVTRAIGRFERVVLHRWRVAFGPHGGHEHEIRHATETLGVSEAMEIDRAIEGNWLMIDDCLTLLLLCPSDSSRPGRWRIRNATDQRDNRLGTHWFEVAYSVEFDPEERIQSGVVIAEAGLIARCDLAPDEVSDWATACSLESTECEVKSWLQRI